MHIRFFDDLMGSAKEASPEFRFEKMKGTFRKNYSSNYLKNVWKIYLKFAQKFQNILKHF